MGMAVILIARFDGNVDELRLAYDRAHALIMSRGGATGAGELRQHCAIGGGAPYIIGVRESEERVHQGIGAAALPMPCSCDPSCSAPNLPGWLGVRLIRGPGRWSPAGGR